MDEPMKRAWSSPELIVLVRGGPEEAVLGGCKHTDHGGGEGSYQSACKTWGATSCGSYCVRTEYS